MSIKSILSKLVVFLGLGSIFNLSNKDRKDAFDGFINQEGNRSQRKARARRQKGYGRKQIIAANPLTGSPRKVIYHRDPVHAKGLAKIQKMHLNFLHLAGFVNKKQYSQLINS